MDDEDYGQNILGMILSWVAKTLPWIKLCIVDGDILLVLLVPVHPCFVRVAPVPTYVNSTSLSRGTLHSLDDTLDLYLSR